MPIPTRRDHQLDDLENLHASIMIALRTWQHAGHRRDPDNIRRLLVNYADSVVDFVNTADQ